MRISRTVVLITAATMIVAVGCTKQVAGAAESDPNKPPLTSQQGRLRHRRRLRQRPYEDRDLHRTAVQSLCGSPTTSAT
jgi:hypothetical protein